VKIGSEDLAIIHSDGCLRRPVDDQGYPGLLGQERGEVVEMADLPAATPSSSAPSPPAPELPTSSAELKISLGPSQRWSAQGNVPAHQVHLLVTTFGVLGSVVTGITGAILTLRITNTTTGVALALAELALALVAAVLIAVVARPRGTARRRSS
jgi:hypothetical protein